METTRALACVFFLLVLAVTISAFVLPARPIEHFGHSDTYLDDLYGVPSVFIATGSDQSAIQCAAGDVPCPVGMACNPATGLCALVCDGSTVCPGDLVCSAGLCLPNHCPAGEMPHPETGVCGIPCSVDGDCPDGKVCRDGFCACPMDPTPCHGGMDWSPKSCSCECEEGYLWNEGEGMCSPDDGSWSDASPDDGADDSDDPTSTVAYFASDTSDTHCNDGWPPPAQAALVQGFVFRLYRDAMPCSFVVEFEETMSNSLGFKDALERCAGGDCDGVAICNSKMVAIGFRFPKDGGKETNPYWFSPGDYTILKEGTGSCGAAGRPAGSGRCVGLVELAGGVAASDGDGNTSFEGHAACTYQPIPFLNPGVHPDNFPSDNVMLVRDDDDAELCKQICKLDSRCDAVELTDQACRLYRMPFNSVPALKTQKGTTTVIMDMGSISAADELKQMADRADYGSASGGGAPRIPGLFLRVWDQKKQEEGYTENLSMDGLFPEHRYSLTLEGPVSTSKLAVSLGWNSSLAKNVITQHSQDHTGGFVAADAIGTISFQCSRLCRVEDAIWLEDRAGRRSHPFNLLDAHPGKPRGTLTTFSNNMLSVKVAEVGPDEDYSHGQIVFSGDIASRGNNLDLPSVKDVLRAVKLTDIRVDRTGAVYRWRPASKNVPPKLIHDGGGDWHIIHNLSFPSVAIDSTIVVYMGKIQNDLVPVSRVVAKKNALLSPLPAAPSGFSPVFVTSQVLDSSDRTSSVSVESPGPSACALRCEETTCNIFRVTDGGCDLYSVSNQHFAAGDEAFWSKDAEIAYKKDPPLD